MSCSRSSTRGPSPGINVISVEVRWFDTITRDDALMIGIIAAVLGPIGDLSKSMLKRAGGAKDSGKLFLAHGGMLDRIDAVLFDAVGVLGYVTLVHR